MKTYLADRSTATLWSLETLHLIFFLKFIETRSTDRVAKQPKASLSLRFLDPGQLHGLCKILFNLQETNSQGNRKLFI